MSEENKEKGQPDNRAESERGLPEEAAILLDSIDAGEEAEASSCDEETDLNAPGMPPEFARKEAEMLVGVVLTNLSSIHPALAGGYPENVRVGLVDKVAPVVEKYDGLLPSWLEKWKEEISLGMAVGGLLYGSVMAIKQHNRAVKSGQEKGTKEGGSKDE